MVSIQRSPRKQDGKKNKTDFISTAHGRKPIKEPKLINRDFITLVARQG